MERELSERFAKMMADKDREIGMLRKEVARLLAVIARSHEDHFSSPGKPATETEDKL